jgi:carbamoyl-phosphate synthase small subunit
MVVREKTAPCKNRSHKLAGLTKRQRCPIHYAIYLEKPATFDAKMMMPPRFAPPQNAVLILADGQVFLGHGIGKAGICVGELCFNTAMSGYQEILTDPSYSGQIVTFTTPHIGNIGCNKDDAESTSKKGETTSGALGIITREIPRIASNFRSELSFNAWLIARNTTGIAGIDTRALTHYIREYGAQNAAIAFDENADQKTLLARAQKALNHAPNMAGLELAKQVTTSKSYQWNQPLWAAEPIAANNGTNSEDSMSEPALSSCTSRRSADRSGCRKNPLHIVVVDYGVKHNILRHFASLNCKLTVMPATARAQEILAQNPDGVFLSNGPADPAATAQYAVAEIKILLQKNIPIFGICLGHQLLAIALGARTVKMTQGHRGANHPVQNLQNKKVEITSQNHGFAVSDEGLPDDVKVTHRSLFDGSIAGIAHKTKPVFSVQYHPEASPGPHDSHYLFTQFVSMMNAHKQRENHAA